MKMGGMEGMMGMMPGMGKMAKQMADAGMDDKVLKRQIALIQSMTKKERANPRSCRPAARNASRKVQAWRSRTEQAAQNAPPDGRHDEEDGQEAAC